MKYFMLKIRSFERLIHVVLNLLNNRFLIHKIFDVYISLRSAIEIHLFIHEKLIKFRAIQEVCPKIFPNDV